MVPSTQIACKACGKLRNPKLDCATTCPTRHRAPEDRPVELEIHLQDPHKLLHRGPLPEWFRRGFPVPGDHFPFDGQCYRVDVVNVVYSGVNGDGVRMAVAEVLVSETLGPKIDMQQIACNTAWTQTGRWQAHIKLPSEFMGERIDLTWEGRCIRDHGCCLLCSPLWPEDSARSCLVE